MTVTHRWFFATFAVLPLLFTLEQYSASTPNLTWWTADALEKVRPDDQEPTHLSRVAHLAAARNEFEPFQIVLRSQAADINDVDVDLSDLRSASGDVLLKSNVTAYFERYLDLKKPSSIDGAAGEWPDPLIPRVDHFAKERRNAFPFHLLKGRNQPLWFDVYIPANTRAGTYKGSVHVLISGHVTIDVPVDVEVWNFSLPSTSSLPTAFGFSGIRALRQHFGKYTNDQDLFQLTELYEKDGLWHRITIDGSVGVQPPVHVIDGKVHVDWKPYDAHISPMMDGGMVSADEPLYGAKATTVTQRTPPALNTPDAQVQYWRLVSEHFRQKGWMDRLLNYLWDEPKQNEYARMSELGKRIHEADPDLRNLVTAPLHPGWSDFVDIWTPVINCFDRKPWHRGYCDPTVSRKEYDAEISKGKKLWWYQACSSHGCNVIGGDYFRNWPSYMIDHDGVRNRVMEWLTWKYGIEGELYFSTDEAYGGRDPWTDVNLFGGNGDGTLFYPGTPDIIGGKTHIPIESIRLKLIREGMEDYEYLLMLAKYRGADHVKELIDHVVRNTYDFDHDPQKLYDLRMSIGRELNALSHETDVRLK